MNWPEYNSLGVVFQWVLLTLTCYRLQRIVTADTWYPSEAWRSYLDRKARPAKMEERQNIWTELAEFFSCPYCFGWWVTLAVFAVAAQVISVPLPVLQAVAASGVVGYLGLKE